MSYKITKLIDLWKENGRSLGVCLFRLRLKITPLHENQNLIVMNILIYRFDFEVLCEGDELRKPKKFSCLCA